MDKKISIFSFPNNRNEALAMLYLQNQDLSDKSPSDINTMYFEALYEIRKDYKEKCEQRFFDEL